MQHYETETWYYSRHCSDLFVLASLSAVVASSFFSSFFFFSQHSICDWIDIVVIICSVCESSFYRLKQFNSSLLSSRIDRWNKKDNMVISWKCNTCYINNTIVIAPLYWSLNTVSKCFQGDISLLRKRSVSNA